MFLVIKLAVTAILVVLISEVVKHSGKAGALIAALPIVTVLVLVWMAIEKQPADKMAKHAYYTFWYVLPSLPMFLLFPVMIQRYPFWLTLLSCVVLTMLCFVLLAWLLKHFGVHLLG